MTEIHYETIFSMLKESGIWDKIILVMLNYFLPYFYFLKGFATEKVAQEYEKRKA